MGVDYYLLKKEKGELYELGKSVGRALPLDNLSESKEKRIAVKQTYKIKDVNKYDGDLALEIEAECHHFEDYEECVKNGWFKKVADDIIKWCGDDDIVTLLDMDFGENGYFYWSDYRQTGSAYQD